METSTKRQIFLEIATRSVQEMGGVVLFVDFPVRGHIFKSLWVLKEEEHLRPDKVSPSPFALLRPATAAEVERQFRIVYEVSGWKPSGPIEGEPWFAVTD